MIDMEQRAWITIEGFPAAADEDRWGPFISALERDAHGYGPVLAWDDDHTAVIAMSADVNEAADLAVVAIGVTAAALRTTGLGELYPSALRIEPAGDEQPVAA